MASCSIRAASWRVALAHARRVDQHEALLAELFENVRDVGEAVGDVDGHVEHLAEGLHLVVRADADAVGGDEREAARAMSQ